MSKNTGQEFAKKWPHQERAECGAESTRQTKQMHIHFKHQGQGRPPLLKHTHTHRGSAAECLASSQRHMTSGEALEPQLPHL